MDLMSRPPGFTEELSLGQEVSSAFRIYRGNFSKFFAFFLLFELVIGGVGVLAGRIFIRPVPPANPGDTKAFLSYTFSLLDYTFTLLILTAVVSIAIGSVALGFVTKLASDQIQKSEVGRGALVRFALSRWASILAVGFLVGVMVFLGSFALFVPGVILGIMFCLAIPVVIIEPIGVIGSLSRSRELVSHRWQKTFGLLLVFGLIGLVIGFAESPIGALFGVAGWVVTAVISAFYGPLVPLALTVHYYSNVARLSPPQFPTQTFTSPSARFCRFCGAELGGGAAIYCPSCGIRQQA